MIIISTAIEDKKELLREKLSKIRKELLNTIKNISSEALNRKKSSNDETWSIIEVVRHLFVAEKGMTTLMISINNGGQGVPEDFDLNRYNKRSVQKLVEKNIEAIIDGFEENRLRLFEFLAEISNEDFTKKGRHASLRILTIEQIFNLIGDHEQSHLEKIKTEI